MQLLLGCRVAFLALAVEEAAEKSAFEHPPEAALFAFGRRLIVGGGRPRADGERGVIRDRRCLCRLHLEGALTAAGFVVELEADGEEAWFRGDTETFDAIVLDLGLPTLDGLTVLKRWRRAGRLAPVLILTARGQWDDRVDGIEAGADGYVVKPFRIEEVLARVRALIRRAGGFATSRIEIGDLVLDTRVMQVSRAGVPVPLTPQEYRLVAYLAHQRGRVVSQLEITEHLYAQDFERDSNSIEVLVGRVRKRLGSDIIRTRRGFGYAIGGDEA